MAIDIYFNIPAFRNVASTPFFFMVRRARVDTVIRIDSPSSGTNIFFVCKLAQRRRAGIGLYLVARTRLEYPPPT